jgi:hypothetical protein
MVSMSCSWWIIPAVRGNLHTPPCSLPGFSDLSPWTLDFVETGFAANTRKKPMHWDQELKWLFPLLLWKFDGIFGSTSYFYFTSNTLLVLLWILLVCLLEWVMVNSTKPTRTFYHNCLFEKVVSASGFLHTKFFPVENARCWPIYGNHAVARITWLWYMLFLSIGIWYRGLFSSHCDVLIAGCSWSDFFFAHSISIIFLLLKFNASPLSSLVLFLNACPEFIEWSTCILSFSYM